MTRASDNGPGEPFFGLCDACGLERYDDQLATCSDCGAVICDDCADEHGYDCEPDPEDA